jgi:hypothetical protein
MGDAVRTQPAERSVEQGNFAGGGGTVSAGKAIAIAVLVIVGINLLLYGFMRRRIDAAKREKGVTDDR